jgi:ragB/susD domain protein
MNPTQDFADAFPYRNGVPYVPGNPSDPDDPYAGRDPRLDEYLIRNGSLFKDNVINTVDGDVDGIDRKPSSSTTTGYYMKKLMNPSVNHTTGSVVTTRHFHTLLRMTEVYLIFAEAANEAWGPDGQGTVGYSARDVIARIRSTGGITPDQYLPTVATQADMRRLIRNERRLELAFENQRFWDVRRWKDEQAMMRAAMGTRDGGKTAFEVESRVFMDYMIYGPIPYDEQMKGLEQNRGW